MIKQGLKLNTRYILKEKLGQGSFGEVWTAKDTLLDESVAVKFVSTTSHDKFNSVMGN